MNYSVLLISFQYCSFWYINLKQQSSNLIHPENLMVKFMLFDDNFHTLLWIGWSQSHRFENYWQLIQILTWIFLNNTYYEEFMHFQRTPYFYPQLYIMVNHLLHKPLVPTSLIKLSIASAFTNSKWAPLLSARCDGRHHQDREPGGRLNKKDGLTRYGDSHVKDKTS